MACARCAASSRGEALPLSPESPHAELVPFLFGELEPGERAEFERHLASCESCSAELRELSGTVERGARAEQSIVSPARLTESVMAAIEDAAAQETAAEGRAVDAGPALARPGDERLANAPARGRPIRRDRRFWLPRVGIAIAGVAAVGLAFVVDTWFVADEDLGERAGAPLELAGTLQGSGGQASITVEQLGSGREVRLRSQELGILPTGEYYELWFVAPDDRPGDPHRISAGTFHPDEEGVTDVAMHVAVDPSLFPSVEVTAESDRDPGPSEQVITSLDASDVLTD